MNHAAYHPVTLEESAGYYALWRLTPCRSLDYSLANLWGWREHYGLEWRFDRDLCWIRQTRPALQYWAPVGDWAAADWAALLPGLDDAPVIRVPDELAASWQACLPGRVDVIEDRGQWEYLYDREALATLPGNRYHKKKNHVNSFGKAYGEPDYRPLDDLMVEDVLGLQDDWCQWHECESSPSLRAENEAINRVLSHWDRFEGLRGGSLYVEGRMVAFSVGEQLDDRTLGVHFEKGLNGYRGVYQTMNCLFARHEGADFAFLNRAQDLDEEGLRQAKMTYLPVDFVRKSRVCIR
ncbi:phosphatidylglycerol lysyltransferase domain-containing protein [uncultured Desulfovibrio sp.]|uniref:DUF2156 domain-containing protein n=1 Tax=Candidatus Desulfovibrio intestinavium TaxID=2838534 RepID=A0A9D2KPD8_9BACT|nr:phosphatidylglycerol lysyltransferase domain-containing protein [uncultured Desulfovibrio sp.]HJA78672.1 DUF2156 domain-containing protein [Candidatus Desulfovibrio intestinavium]